MCCSRVGWLCVVYMLISCVLFMCWLCVVYMCVVYMLVVVCCSHWLLCVVYMLVVYVLFTCLCGVCQAYAKHAGVSSGHSRLQYVFCLVGLCGV